MKRFQYSLLPLIFTVLMLAGILYPNLQPSPLVAEIPVIPIEEGLPIPPEHVLDTRWHGWPFPACTEWFAKDFTDPNGPVVMNGRDWFWRGLAGNILAGLTIAVAGGALCESAIRHHARTSNS